MAIFSKSSKLYSVSTETCPRCHEGALYRGALLSSSPFAMHDRCAHCGQSYMLEPGFYWGSMYVTYALNSGFCFIAFAVACWGFGLSVDNSLIVMAIAALIAWVPVYRLSRAIWINIFVNYDATFV